MQFSLMPRTSHAKRILLIFALAFSLFLPAHLLWFSQTPVWYPLRCFLNGFPITLFLFLPALLCARISRPWLIATTLLLFIPSILAGMHLYFYQTTLSQQSLFAIFESNLNESWEFIQSQLSLGAVLFLTALIGLPLILLCKLLHIEPQNTRGTYALSAALIATLLVLIGTGKSGRLCRDNLACQLVQSVCEYRRTVREVQDYLARCADIRVPNVAATSNAPITLAVLIGESSSRHHWNLYGYHRPTTPKLSAMRDDLLVFSDAVSPYGRTTLSVAAALTCAGVPNAGDIPLTAVFKQAGFETIWLSNQSTIDDSNLIIRLVSHADRHIYLNKGGDQAYARSYDEKILPALEALLKEPNAPQKRIIFIHMMGSHVNYGSRFPDIFDKFNTDTDIRKKPWFSSKAVKYINDYDNSILYTDHVIASVIERMRLVPGGAVLFFSDHGEEVFDTRKHHGHHNSLASRYYVDIPHLIWLSDSYRASMPEGKLNIWKERQSAPFINSAAPYIMLDLCGVYFDTPHMADSPLSPQWKPAPRVLLGHDYDKLYSNGRGLAQPIPFHP
ncbi:sulfatase-like hydrolase/transferase [Mailhella sp.]|uniref:sulfatase-like hydrolase/transferase n=1 Tax=Mailhella sp. TaxID=1981029 RepID=UPI0040644AA2